MVVMIYAYESIYCGKTFQHSQYVGGVKYGSSEFSIV